MQEALQLRLHEYHDVVPLISTHVYNYGHMFNRENVEILNRENTRNTKAWYSAQSLTNKLIEIDPI